MGGDMMNQEQLVAAVTAAVRAQLEKQKNCVCPDEGDLIPVGVSNRHLHVSAADFYTLFGPDAEMTRFKDLSQPGQFACKEMVTVAGPAGAIERVRILGPARKQTQLEVSVSDCFKLGVKAPIRDSGDLGDSAPITIVGPKGAVTLTEGCIIAAKHIHMHTTDAARLGLKDKDLVDVKACTKRGLIFLEVLVRVGDKFHLEMHVDLDEANAASLKNGDKVKIINIHKK